MFVLGIGSPGKFNSLFIYFRNKVCLFFLLSNALFVTVVFILQQINSQEGSNLSIKLFCATDKKGESVEPISVSFTLVFGLLLVRRILCNCLYVLYYGVFTNNIFHNTTVK